MGPLVAEVQANTLPISEIEKFRPHFFIPLYSITNLQLEQRGEFVLDQFYALNPPVSSVCTWDQWLLRYKQKHFRFLRMKISAHTSSFPCTASPTYNQNGMESWFYTNLMR